MTYPLPILTWERSDISSFSSPTVFDILTSLNSIFVSSSYWEVKSTDISITGSSDYYLEVGPITSASSSYVNQRIIFAGGANPNSMSVGYTANASRLMINYCPDITGRTESAANWKTADPFSGSSIPGKGFVKLGDTFSTITRLYGLICQEGVILNLRKGLGTNTAYPFMAGALVDPGHGNGGDANNRRWILASQGSYGTWNSSTHAAIPQTSANFFLKNTSTTNDYPHAFVWKESDDTWDYSVVCDTAHDIEATLSNNRDIVDDQGYIVPPPMRVVGGNGSPNRAYGFLRQIYFCIIGQDAVVKQGLTSNDLYFVWSPVSSSDGDAFMVTNF